MRGVLLRSTAGPCRGRDGDEQVRGTCRRRSGGATSGGAGCRISLVRCAAERSGVPDPETARRRARRRRAGHPFRARPVRSTRVTPAGPEDVPVEFVRALRSLRGVTRPPRGDPRRGARPGAHRAVLRGADRRGPHGAPLGRRRGARLRTLRRPVRPRGPGGVGRPLPPGDARARDARGRGRRRPDARRGRVDVVHRRARGVRPGRRTRPAARSRGCSRRASAPSSVRAEQTELEIRASWTAADEDLGPAPAGLGHAAVHRGRPRRCPRASSPSGRGADRRSGAARSQRSHLKSTRHDADDWHVSIEPLRRDVAPVRRPELRPGVPARAPARPRRRDPADVRRRHRGRRRRRRDPGPQPAPPRRAPRRRAHAAREPRRARRAARRAGCAAPSPAPPRRACRAPPSPPPRRPPLPELTAREISVLRARRRRPHATGSSARSSACPRSPSRATWPASRASSARATAPSWSRSRSAAASCA